MLYHLDTCSIFRSILIVDGWSEFGAPEVLYKDEPVPCTTLSVPRPDVVAAFDERAVNWGFRLSAFLSPDMTNQEHLSLRFGGKEIVRSPGTALVSDENHQFNVLTQTLLQQSKPGDRVLEIGSRARSGNTYRFLVHPEVEYVGMDIAEGPNVDVVGDAHHLSRHVTGQFDTIFSISVFEHLLMPWMVALEMNKVLKVGGTAYIQSHPSFPLHDEPWDFWRFSKDAWEGLFNAHTGFEIIGKGQSMRCRIAPETTAMSNVQPGFDSGRSYLLSACLVRKIGPAKVSWEAEAGEVYNLAYGH
ncbi:class I SAM-dependent methyltransferase [Paraburkholderia sp.]|uniref:class I SAM-dependent methyltransferase n=1 Tax=Paraburkholderia sp. TaxID=1926495 RepID=UPI003C7ECA3B